MQKEYFDLENYKCRHFYVDNFEPFRIEAIAWERMDGSQDGNLFSYGTKGAVQLNKEN